MLKAGQNILLNNRLWMLKQVRFLEGRNLELEAIGASAASLGMMRTLSATLYEADLFIKQRRDGYWRANLKTDWVEGDFGPVLEAQAATQLDLLDAHTQHPARGELKNQFSWSYSRAAKYRTCPRAYYYHYYAAWEGWQTSAPAPIQRVYLLKNLKNLPAWVGILLHETIKFAMSRFKAGQPLTAADLIEHIYRRAQSDFADSASGRYQQKPNQRLGLQEHYYQTPLPADVWETSWAKAKQLLQTFLNSPLYANLQHQPATTFLKVEELQSFPLKGAKIWVQMDLAHHTDGMIYLYDWKTGQIDTAELQRQLGVYGLYARHAWPSLRAAPLKAVVYALAEDRLLEFNLSAEMLQKSEAIIETSIMQLQDLLLDSQDNLAQLRRFPMIDNLNLCARCQFRELCGR